MVAGYDFADSDSDPSPPTSGANNDTTMAHGTACAGLIAATHNSKGISGLAPDCKIMPIKIWEDEGNTIENNELDEAINWAWENGADVLSNSWGFGNAGATFWLDNVADAIDSARTYGRGGSGSIVVFSAGNNGTYAAFPSTVPGVICVGATDLNDNQQGYSPSDNEIVVVAPSGETSHNGDVWTLDISGDDGYNPLLTGSGDANGNNNYTARFGGTSAAAPLVSGLAALIISVNSTLAETSVYDMITQNIDDLGPTGRDNDFGYGRINAYKAVNATVAALPADVMNIANFSVSNSGDKIRLTWDNPSSNFAGGIVLRSTSSISWKPKQGVSPSNQSPPSGVALVTYGNISNYLDNNLIEGTSYYYLIYTYNNLYNYSFFGVSQNAIPQKTTSNSPLALAFNNQRKLVYDNFGDYHLKFPQFCGHTEKLYINHQNNGGVSWKQKKLAEFLQLNLKKKQLNWSSKAVKRPPRYLEIWAFIPIT